MAYTPLTDTELDELWEGAQGETVAEIPWVRPDVLRALVTEIRLGREVVSAARPVVAMLHLSSTRFKRLADAIESFGGPHE